MVTTFTERPTMKTIKKLSLAFLCSFALHQHAYSGSHPSFAIIGAQKCGTTSLYNYLIQHPLISSATKKEIHYFDNSANLKQGAKWYLSHFPNIKPPKLTGEATPMLFRPEAPQKIKKLYPNMKLIVLLRDPVARAFSNYKMCVGNGQEKESFEKALLLEDKREKAAKAAEIFHWPRFSYSKRGHYAQALKRWFKYFPKDQILVLIFEEFFADPPKNLNKVFKFLGVPKYTLKTYEQFYPSALPDLKINKDTETKLKKFYQPYNQELEKLLGRTLPWN